MRTREVNHGTVPHLQKLGLLHDNLLAAHTVWVNETEVSIFYLKVEITNVIIYINEDTLLKKALHFTSCKDCKGVSYHNILKQGTKQYKTARSEFCALIFFTNHYLIIPKLVFWELPFSFLMKL